MDVVLSNLGVFITADGAWTIAACTAGTNIGLPDYTTVLTTSSAPTADGVSLSVQQVANYFVLGKVDNEVTVYIPPNGYCYLGVLTSNDQTGKTLIADVKYFYFGEWKTSTLAMAGTTQGFMYSGKSGVTGPDIGQLFDGFTPIGFARITGLRVGPADITTAATTPVLRFGWATGPFTLGATASGSVNVMFPVFTPPEFGNSIVPYLRTRSNATAALFTNVTAVLSKEGTILAARLKATQVPFYNFTSDDVNAVHPRQRYFGPLEKGLYTFTTPDQPNGSFYDSVYPIPTAGVSSGPYVVNRPLFQPDALGVYNAIILTDLGSSTEGTMLATSLYTHLEFECVSSLFSPGVSTYTLEQLHAAEVALLSFGHFHENPLHWAALKSAAMSALRIVGPMVAPIIQKAGVSLVNKGVSYLKGKPSGDRRMTQSPPGQTTRAHAPVVKKKKAKVTLPQKKR